MPQTHKVVQTCLRLEGGVLNLLQQPRLSMVERGAVLV